MRSCGCIVLFLRKSRVHATMTTLMIMAAHDDSVETTTTVHGTTAPMECTMNHVNHRVVTERAATIMKNKIVSTGDKEDKSKNRNEKNDNELVKV